MNHSLKHISFNICIAVISSFSFSTVSFSQKEDSLGVDLKLKTPYNDLANFFTLKVSYIGGLNGVSLIGDNYTLSFDKDELTTIANKNGNNPSDIDIYTNDEQSLQTVNYTLGYGAGISFLTKTSNPKLYFGPYLSYKRLEFDKTTYGVLYGANEYTFNYTGITELATIGAEFRYNLISKPKSTIFIEGGFGLAFSFYRYDYEKKEDNVVTFISESEEFKGKHFAFPIDLGIGYSYKKFGINVGLTTAMVTGRKKQDHTSRKIAGDTFFGKLTGKAGGEVEGYIYETVNKKKSIAAFYSIGISYRLFSNIK